MNIAEQILKNQGPLTLSSELNKINKLPDGLKQVDTPDLTSHSSNKPSFSKVIGDLVNDVDQLHKKAEDTTEKLVTGELEDVHQVMVAMEEAQTSFRLLMEVRNKMVEAYKEVIKMQA